MKIIQDGHPQNMTVMDTKKRVKKSYKKLPPTWYSDRVNYSYIIALEREHERLKTFRETSDVSKHFQVVEAIDGRELTKENCPTDSNPIYDWRYQLKVSPDPSIIPLNKNLKVIASSIETSICLSQAKAWKKFIQDGKSGDWAMFVESDTIFQNEFGHNFCEVWDSIDLKDTHMLYLNYLPDEWGFSVKVYNDKVFRIKNGCWFMATYLLSWDGPKGLIDRFPIVGPLDTWIQHQYDFLRPLASRKFLSLQGNGTVETQSSNVYSFNSVDHNPLPILSADELANFNWRPIKFNFDDSKWIRDWDGRELTKEIRIDNETHTEIQNTR